MVFADRKEGKDSTGRPLPEVHPGPGVVYGLTPEEEHEWRKWSPKVGDVVLVETAEDGIWPGKVSRGLATVFSWDDTSQHLSPLSSNRVALARLTARSDHRQEDLLPRSICPSRVPLLPRPDIQ